MLEGDLFVMFHEPDTDVVTVLRNEHVRPFFGSVEYNVSFSTSEFMDKIMISAEHDIGVARPFAEAHIRAALTEIDNEFWGGKKGHIFADPYTEQFEMKRQKHRIAQNQSGPAI